MFAALALLALLSTPALAISIGLILPDSNVWTSLTYTITVPPPPPSTVTTGPWFFWAGVQPPAGVVQPVLQWGEAPPAGWVNPDVSFPHVWQMVLWAVPSPDKNGDNADISQGVWADTGAQIRSTVNWANGQWTQTSTVISGGGAGASVSQTLDADQYFDGNNDASSNANFFVLESELYGQQINEWNFDVTFSDITLTAQTSDGVSSTCDVTSHSDGNGFITINGYSLSADGRTCHWDSMVLSPP